MINKHQTRVLRSPNNAKIVYEAYFRATNQKRGVIYILIAILFFVHLRVNVAANIRFFF